MTQEDHGAAHDNDGVPDTDILLRRAAMAARGLVDAREAHAGGTSALVVAYEDLAEDHRGLVAELAARDDELARCEAQLAAKDVEAAHLSIRLESVTAEATRSADEANRLADVAREALGQVRATHADNDRLKTAHDTLAGEHRRLSLAFQELISQVGQDARGLSDEGKRINGIVPAPAVRTRPAPLRSPAAEIEVALPAPAPRPPALASRHQMPAPVAAPPLSHLTGDLEADIRHVIGLSIVPQSREAVPAPPALVVDPDEREDMSQALSSFGSLRHRKIA